jgi:hypothetical protein
MDFSHQACQKESQRMMPVLYGTGRKTQVIPYRRIYDSARENIKEKFLFPKTRFSDGNLQSAYPKTLL